MVYEEHRADLVGDKQTHSNPRSYALTSTTTLTWIYSGEFLESTVLAWIDPVRCHTFVPRIFDTCAFDRTYDRNEWYVIAIDPAKLTKFKNTVPLLSLSSASSAIRNLRQRPLVSDLPDVSTL